MAVSAASPTHSSDVYSQLGIGQQNTPRATSGNDLGMDSFLRLMTEQMKNQDPTKPMDSSAYLGQLAQFASVKGLQQLDTRLQGVVSVLGQQEALQAPDLIGHNAFIKTDSADFTTGKTLQGRVVATGSGPITIQIKDASGNVVRELSADASGAGDVDFTWDGLDSHGQPAPSGPYKITAASNGKSLDTQIAARIESISFTAQGAVINLDGHDGITFDQILSID